MDNKDPQQKENDSEDDSISLTSTIMSVHSENEFFEVEKILAENPNSKSETFLIKWEGYPISRATWEPRNQIRHLRPVMNEWRHRQSLEESGELEPFDTAAWVAARQKSEDEKQERKSRRLSKKKRLQKIENFGLERNLMFLPNIDQPPDIYDELSSLKNENFSKDDIGVRTKIEPDETLVSESCLYLNSKKFDKYNDDLENISNLPETAAVHFGGPEHVGNSLNQHKISQLGSAEKHGPTLSTRIIGTNHRRERKSSSSSSDEPLAQLIRRSKALQASTKAIQETSVIAKSQPRVLISQLASDSSSSESDSLENQSLSSLLKSRLINNSAISAAGTPSDISNNTSNLLKKSPIQIISHSIAREKIPIHSEDKIVSAKDSKGSCGRPITQKLLRSRLDSPEQLTPSNYNNEAQISDHQPRNNSNTVLNSEKVNRSINSLSPRSQEKTSVKIQLNTFSDINRPEKKMNDASKFNHSASQTDFQNIDQSIAVSDREQRRVDIDNLALSSKKKDLNIEHIPAILPTNVPTHETGVATCFFWNESTCKFGNKCRYLHANAGDNQISSPPRSSGNITNSIDLISSRETSNSKKQKKKLTTSPTISSASEISDKLIRDKRIDTPTLTKSSKNSFQRNSLEETFTFNQNSKSDTQNINRMNLDSSNISDSAPLSQYVLDNPASTTCHSAQSLSSHFPMIQEKPLARIHSNHSVPKLNFLSPQENSHGGKNRPSWDPKDPSNAVCYFWHKDGVCQRLTCPFYHSLEPQIPIAPSPKQQRKIKKKSEVCRFWLRNDCIHTASSCRFRHCLEPENSNNTPKNTVRELTMDDVLTTKVSLPKKRFSTDELNKSEVDASFTTTITDLHDSPAELHNSIEIETEALRSIEECQSISSPAVDIMDEKTLSLLPNSDFDTQLQTTDLNSGPEVGSDQYESNHQKHYEFEDGRGMIKQVILGIDNLSPIALDFGNFDAPAENSWKKSFTSKHGIHFKHLCLAQDLEYQMGLCRIPVLWQESVRSIDPDDVDTTKIIETIVNELVVRCGGLLAIIGDIVLLLYPAKREEWRFLDQLSNITPDVRLRYCLLSYNFNQELHKISAISVGSTSYIQFLVHKIQKFLIPDLLQDFVLKEDKNLPPGKFFLIFPPSASQMANFMKFCLFSYNINFKVYGSMTPGSWDVFSQSSSYKSIHDHSEKLVPSIVLIHESIATEICRLPKLSDILDKPEVVFWQISEGISRNPPYPSRYLASNLKLGHITATKLFPHGCAVLLTPSFLVAEPTAALDFIKWFMIERFPNQATPWRIVGAHDLPQYILDVAKSKAFEALSYESRHSKSPNEKINQVLEGRFLGYTTCKDRWDLYTELTNLNTRSPDDSDFEDELEDCFIRAPASIHPENEHDLIRWFAGWSTINSDMFRKFLVIGTGTSNAPRAKYLKKITPKSAITNSDISKVTPQRSATATMINETTPIQKISPTALSNTPSRAQTLNSLIGEAIIAKPKDPISSDIASSSSRYPSDLLGSNQNHQSSEFPDSKASYQQTPPPHTKTAALAYRDEPDLDKESSRPGEISTSPNNTTDGKQVTRQAPQKKWKEMKFEATTEWYKRLQARGDAWEHITVVEHIEAWKLIGFGTPV